MPIRPVWDIRLQEPAVAERLMGAGVPYLNALVLAARGVTESEEVRAFTARGNEELHDPMRLADMDKAVDRIKAALRGREIVAVYGDYDVDGVTSTVLLYECLTALGANVVRYIPNRLNEGHGLRADVLEHLKEAGASLVVTVDTGISATAEAAHAKELGLDLIIVDHHECPDTLPDALAVVDPKRPGSGYPFTELAGVGVTFKLVCALEGDNAKALRRYGDLVALGTVADVVPLDGENRDLVRLGLEILAETQRPGLRALMKEAFCEGRVTAQTVAFKLAPRLNAAGRMDRADVAVDLLLCDNQREAGRLAALLGELNLTRKSIESDVFQQAMRLIETMEPEATRYAAVLEGEDWHEGVTGIVASQLVERLGVPVFLISLGEGPYGKGSARGVPSDHRAGGGVNLAGALTACRDLLEAHGGHELAAGFRVLRENIPALRDALTDYCRKAADGEAAQTVPDCAADAVADPAKVTLSEVHALEALEPFGAGNPEPVLVFENTLIRGVEPLKEGAHTRLTLDAGGCVFSAIWFGMRPERLGVGRDELADAAFTLEINTFRETERIQLHMRAIRPSREQAELDMEQWDTYTRFCEGAIDIKPALISRMRPSRSQMGTVWRGLTREGRVQMKPLALARTLGGDHIRRLPVGMVWVALDVFAEYDLIELKKGSAWIAEAKIRTVKTDIEGSQILANLDRLC